MDIFDEILESETQMYNQAYHQGREAGAERMKEESY